MEQLIGVERQRNNQEDTQFLETHIGQSISNFLSAFRSGSQLEMNKAFALLNDLPELVLKTESLDFLSGLAGIGWGVEWIVQNSFADFNTDEILEDIDDELYKAVLYASQESLHIANGTLGLVLYFQMRNNNINPKSNRYRQLCFQECLVLLTDDIRYKIDELILPNTKFSDLAVLRSAGQSLMVLGFLLQDRVNVYTIEKSFYQLMEWSQLVVKNGLQMKLAGENLQGLSFLCACAYTASIENGYKQWATVFASFVSSLNLMRESAILQYTYLVYNESQPHGNIQSEFVYTLASLTKAGRNSLNHILLIC